MSEAVFVRTESGVVMLMDVPADGSHARERWDARMKKGEWSLVPHAVAEVRADGSTVYVEAPAPKPKGRRSAEVAPEPEVEVPADPDAQVDPDPAPTSEG